MKPDAPLLDTATVRSLYEPAGEWAKECGLLVRAERVRLGFTISRLSELADTNVQTIYKVERGLIVPREYLKASIAYALSVEVMDLWGPLTRRKLASRARAIPA